MKKFIVITLTLLLVLSLAACGSTEQNQDSAQDEKIKIGDNEEMNTPFELKSKSSEKTEIRDKSGTEIGNVKFYPDTGKLKVKDAANNEKLILKNFHNSAAPGVILFEEIPVKIRCIIINELIKKGK